MTFTVSIRDSGGKLKTIEIEAPDRASLFKELSARKLSAVRVSEAAKNSPRRSAPGKRTPRFLFFVVGALLFVSALFLIHKFTVRQPRETPPSQQTKRTKTSAPRVTQKIDKPSNPPSPASNVVEKTVAEKLMEGKDPEHWIVIKGRDGKEFLSKRSIPGRRRHTPPLYKHSALNALDAILFKDAADPLIGVKVDERFKESYTKAIVEGIQIEKNDPEDIVLRKQGMIEALQQINDAIKNGGSLEEIVNDALRQRRALAEFKAQMKQERKTMRLNGESEEAIAEFEKACNKMLGEKGAKPLLTKEAMLENFEKQKAKQENP